MPKLELLSVKDALLKSASGKRAQIMREYLGYLEQLKEGQAGKLQATSGETASAIRRRLGAASRLADKSLVVKRTGDEVYFWLQAKGRRGRRRGRPRKAAAS